MLSPHVKSGDTFLLTAENVTFAQFMERLQSLEPSVQAPRFTIPPLLSRVGAFCLRLVDPANERYDAVFVEMGNRYWNVSAQRAVEVLNFSPRPVRDTLSDTISYVKMHPASAGSSGETKGNACKRLLPSKARRVMACLLCGIVLLVLLRAFLVQ